MKGILVVLLGTMIWSGSLLWPEVNLLLTPPVMLAILAGLTALLSLSLVVAHLNQRRRPRCCEEPPCRNVPDCTTRPATMTLSPR